jgi:hypothetical protein
MAVTLEIESDDPEAVFSAIFGSGTPILGQVARRPEGLSLINMSPNFGLTTVESVTLLVDGLATGPAGATLYDLLKTSARALVVGTRRIILAERERDAAVAEIGAALEGIAKGASRS